jgi:hypothetical protein
MEKNDPTQDEIKLYEGYKNEEGQTVSLESIVRELNLYKE